MDTMIPLLIDGLADAALIFFVAVGLTLVFSVLHILNVAHGSFYSLGAYVAVTVGTWILASGAARYLSLPALLVSALLVAALLGPLVERTLIRWTYDKPEALQILVTFGLFLILEDLQKVVFGVQPYYQDAPVQLLGSLTIGGLVYLNYHLVLIALALLVAIGLRLILRRTRFGKLVTAVVADREVAQVLGVNTERVFVAAFTFGVFLAALGGALATPTSGVAPGIGADAIVLGFAVAAIGGLGQIEGALLAAVIVGLSRVIAIYFAPQLQPVMPYLVMVAVWLVRPHGLFGSGQLRKI